MTTNTCCNYEKTDTDKNRRYDINQLLTIQMELNEFILDGWDNVLSPCNFQVAMLDEFAEILGSGVDFKHWKHTDPNDFDEFNVKIEITDIVFFYLSQMIMWESSNSSQFDHCDSSDQFSQFDAMYVGVDKGKSFTGIGILSDNKLIHCNFVSLLTEALEDQGDIYKHIDTVDKIVSSIGLTSEEFSAFYAAKESVNRFRASEGYQDGTYVMVDDQDNQILESLIDDFMEDSSITLEDLKQNVEDALFEEA